MTAGGGTRRDGFGYNAWVFAFQKNGERGHPWERSIQFRDETIRHPYANTIEVVVIGTLKNLLGPHHRNPALGRAWPTMFQAAPKHGRAPGAEYSVIAYGLYEPFTLIHTTRTDSVTAVAK